MLIEQINVKMNCLVTSLFGSVLEFFSFFLFFSLQFIQ